MVVDEILRQTQPPTFVIVLSFKIEFFEWSAFSRLEVLSLIAEPLRPRMPTTLFSTTSSPEIMDTIGILWFVSVRGTANASLRRARILGLST